MPWRSPPDEEIAPQRLLVGQRTVLIDRLDRELVRHANRIVGETQLAVADENATRRGRQHSGHNLDQRRLAGAVVADQAHDLVAANRKIDVVQRPNRTEEFLHPFEADDILEVPLDDLDAGRLAHVAPPRVPRRLRRCFNRLTSPTTAQQSTSNRGYRGSAKRRMTIPRGRPAAADPSRAQRSPCATTERQTPPAQLATGAYAGPNATSGVRAVPRRPARHNGSLRSRAAYGCRRPATISKGWRRLDRRRR